ncbi:zinc finger, CCHC-type containing protein [Tanacetum coccineum]
MGVKEKKQGDGGALSGMGAAKILNTIDDVSKDSDGVNSSPTKVTPGNSAMNKEDNLHDENDGLTPSKSIANPKEHLGYGLAKSMLNSSTGIFSFQFSYMEGLDAMLENGPWFIRNNPLILKKWNPDVNLLKEDVGNVPVWIKLYSVPVTAFSEDGLNAIATKLVAMPKLDECPKNIDLDVVKNMKKSSQTPRGVLVGPKVGFKPVKQVYRQVSKKNNVNTSGNKKKDAEPTIEVSNSNLFDVLNLVENDVDLGTNGGTSNLASKKANFSGSSFWNVESSNDEGKPLTRVDSSGDHDSEDEVASVGNDMANFLASKEVGYGTNSLLEQWKESYENGNYDFDPYDDDMYEGQDIPDKIQDICDSLDIKGVDVLHRFRFSLLDFRVCWGDNQQVVSEARFETRLDSRSILVKGFMRLSFVQQKIFSFKGSFRTSVDTRFFDSKVLGVRVFRHQGKCESKHIDEFHKLVGDLAAIDTSKSNEDQALLLLTFLPSSYDNFVEILLYGRDTLKLEDVLVTLNSRKLQNMTEAKDDGGEGFFVRGRSGQRDMKQRTGFVRNEDQVSCFGVDGYDSADVMMYDDGNVLLGDGSECRVRGTSKVQVQMRVDQVLCWRTSGTRRANCEYTLDGQAVTRKTLKGRKRLGEYQTGWKIKTGGGYNQVFISSEYRSPSSAIGFKTPIDMFGVFGSLASIKQGMLEPVKVKCMFLGYHDDMDGCQLWRLDDVTSKVLQGVEFEVEPQEDHTFNVDPHGNVDHVASSQEVQTHDLMDYHLVRDREQRSAHELLRYREDSNEAAFVVGAAEKQRLQENSDDNEGYYWEYTPVLILVLQLGSSLS